MEVPPSDLPLWRFLYLPVFIDGKTISYQATPSSTINSYFRDSDFLSWDGTSKLSDIEYIQCRNTENQLVLVLQGKRNSNGHSRIGIAVSTQITSVGV